MNIAITNGEVVLKDFCSRKLKKEINNALYANTDLKTNALGKGELSGFNPTSMDKANDVALIGMVEKIFINKEEKQVNLSTFDEMDANDVQTIIDAINKITTKEIPKA